MPMELADVPFSYTNPDGSRWDHPGNNYPEMMTERDIIELAMLELARRGPKGRKTRDVDQYQQHVEEYIEERLAAFRAAQEGLRRRMDGTQD